MKDLDGVACHFGDGIQQRPCIRQGRLMAVNSHEPYADCKGTSLISNSPTLAPYSRVGHPMTSMALRAVSGMRFRSLRLRLIVATICTRGDTLYGAVKSCRPVNFTDSTTQPLPRRGSRDPLRLSQAPCPAKAPGTAWASLFGDAVQELAPPPDGRHQVVLRTQL